MGLNVSAWLSRSTFLRVLPAESSGPPLTPRGPRPVCALSLPSARLSLELCSLRALTVPWPAWISPILQGSAQVLLPPRSPFTLLKFVSNFFTSHLHSELVYIKQPSFRRDLGPQKAGHSDIPAYDSQGPFTGSSTEFSKPPFFSHPFSCIRGLLQFCCSPTPNPAPGLSSPLSPSPSWCLATQLTKFSPPDLRFYPFFRSDRKIPETKLSSEGRDRLRAENLSRWRWAAFLIRYGRPGNAGTSHDFALSHPHPSHPAVSGCPIFSVVPVC